MSNKPKIIFVCTEDWFFARHFQHIAEHLANDQGIEVVLIANTQTEFKNLEGTKIRGIRLNFQRSSHNLFTHTSMAKELWQTLKNEAPDIIHFISFKTIVLGGLASRFLPNIGQIYHLTGQGFYVVEDSYGIQAMRSFFVRLLGKFLKHPKSYLLVENNFDLYTVMGEPPKRDNFAVLGGAGINPDAYPLKPQPQNDIPRISFVGRLVWSKGIDILIDAVRSLNDKGVEVKLDIYGNMDEDNPRVVTKAHLDDWTQHPNIEWHGKVNKIVEVWEKTDIAAFPSRGGEGIPRALLEASATGRPVIVTDVPGCRNFIRDGSEGIIVPKESKQLLADALEKLIKSPELRLKMGTAGRKRLLEGYTEKHLHDALVPIYRKLMDD